MVKRFLVVVLAMISFMALADESRPVQVPFPKFVARPSATVLYCLPIVQSFVEGNGSKATGTTGSTTNPEMKIELLGGVLRASFRDDQTKNYQSPILLNVLFDAPDRYVAISQITDDHPAYFVTEILLNRITGTLIRSDLDSLNKPTDDPLGGVMFEVCSPSEIDR